MGGKSKSATTSNTSNQDNRIAVQDGIGVGAGGSFFAQDNSQETNVFTDSRTFSDSRSNTFSDSRSFDYSDDSVTNITTLDAGAIASALGFGSDTASGAFGLTGKATTDALGFGAQALGFGSSTVNRALGMVELSNASLGDGLGRLLDTAENLFTQNQGLIGQTQKAVADAYGQAQTDAKGTIDNRTITVLAVAGVAALFLLNRK